MDSGKFWFQLYDHGGEWNVSTFDKFERRLVFSIRSNVLARKDRYEKRKRSFF